MAYEIRIVSTALTEMSRWQIPEGIHRTVLDRICNDLGSNPDGSVRLFELDGQMISAFHFELPDPDKANCVYIFMFHVLVKESSIDILAADYDYLDPNAKPPVM